MKRHSSPLVFTNGLTVMLNILACYISSFFFKNFILCGLCYYIYFLKSTPKNVCKIFLKYINRNIHFYSPGATLVLFLLSQINLRRGFYLFCLQNLFLLFSLSWYTPIWILQN